jgi:hypothetical protein
MGAIAIQTPLAVAPPHGTGITLPGAIVSTAVPVRATSALRGSPTMGARHLLSTEALLEWSR